MYLAHNVKSFPTNIFGGDGAAVIRRILFRILSITLLFRLSGATELLGLAKPFVVLLAGLAGLVGLYIVLHQIGEATEWFSAKAGTAKFGPWIRRHRAVSLVLFVLGGSFLGAGAWAWFVYRLRDEPPPATAILVEYEPTTPPDSVRPGQTIYILSIRSDGPSELISTSGNYDIKRGPRVDPFVYYCTISNKGDATVLELEIAYRATFFKGSPNQSPIVSTSPIRIGWPALASNEKFSFYIDNGSEFGLAVQSIPEVTAKIFGREKRQSLRIVPGNWGDFSLLFVPPHVPPKRIS